MHFDWSTLALQTANFAILVWLLRRFLYQPVLRMVDARKAGLQKQHDDAKAVEDKAKVLLAQIEMQRADIAAEREATLKTAASQAQAAAEARRQQAERDAQTLVDAARKSLANERDQALAELRTSALDLGADLARRLLAEIPIKLRAEAWIDRIEQYLKKLSKDEFADLTREFGDGHALRVVTASALPTETADTWRDRLRRLLGPSITVTFEADSSLVAGAELHGPTSILRFSLQSVLATVRSEVGAHDDAH